MNIKEYLLSKHREVENKLKAMDEEQVQSFDETPESLELGTYSWQADTESTKAAIKDQLLKTACSLQKTIDRLKKGTYGLCDRCQKAIEKERLEIIPTATLCVSCLV